MGFCDFCLKMKDLSFISKKLMFNNKYSYLRMRKRREVKAVEKKQKKNWSE